MGRRCHPCSAPCRAVITMTLEMIPSVRKCTMRSKQLQLVRASMEGFTMVTRTT